MFFTTIFINLALDNKTLLQIKVYFLAIHEIKTMQNNLLISSQNPHLEGALSQDIAVRKVIIVIKSRYFKKS